MHQCASVCISMLSTYHYASVCISMYMVCIQYVSVCISMYQYVYGMYPVCISMCQVRIWLVSNTCQYVWVCIGMFPVCIYQGMNSVLGNGCVWGMQGERVLSKLGPLFSCGWRPKRGKKITGPKTFGMVTNFLFDTPPLILSLFCKKSVGRGYCEEESDIRERVWCGFFNWRIFN